MLFIYVSALTIATIILLKMALSKYVNSIVFLCVLFLAFHLQSILLTRLMITSKNKLISINESSAFGATLVALVGVGAYVIVNLFPVSLPAFISTYTTYTATYSATITKYLEGLMVSIPIYMAQWLNQTFVSKL